jgi:hypothetical protein
MSPVAQRLSIHPAQPRRLFPSMALGAVAEVVEIEGGVVSG